MIDLNQPGGAIISECKQYRYALWRTWDKSLPRVMFICLNPSVADATLEDPTLRRCMDFARRWGFGGVCTGNLFAFRATEPEVLRVANNPVGSRNNYWLKRLAADAQLVVAAWGNDGSFMARSTEVRQMFADLHYFKINRSGEPAHPLYLRKSLKPLLMAQNPPKPSGGV